MKTDADLNDELERLISRLNCGRLEGMVKIAQQDVPCGICLGESPLEPSCEACSGSGRDHISAELIAEALIRLAAIQHTKPDPV
jgi:hypothetical protein